MMTENIYLDLTNEFNEGQLRAILSSGQAVVLHRLALASKDGDWIVRETENSLDFILRVLETHGARYRLGAPLDVRWMRGGWSAHFEFSSGNYRARCDFVTRPPRLTENDLRALWLEREQGQNGGLEVPTVDLRRLIELKKTDRERDYAVIGDLARKTSTEDQLLQSRSARDLIQLAENHPQLMEALVPRRPLLSLLLHKGQSRLPVQRALADEQFDLMERNERRLAAYSEAAKKWTSQWGTVQKEIRELPLNQAHKVLLAQSQGILPEEVEHV